MYDINWKIAGIGGMGAMGVGAMFSKFAHRSGYFVSDYSEYNSIIKGGHNDFQVRVTSDKNYVTSKLLQVLLSLDENSYKLLAKTLSSEVGFLICDWAMIKDKSLVNPEHVIDVPFSMINKEKGGDEIMKNIIGMGASIAVVGGDINICKELIKEQFGRKGDEVVNKNNELLQAGFDYVIQKFAAPVQLFQNKYGVMKAVEYKPEMHLIAGNEAIAIGALDAGIGYYAAYPMTPASSLLHYFAPLASKYNLVVKHAEDEIAAINSAIGASFGGARAMTASAGGGFSLMVEGLGLAAITEMPIVIAVITRPGPATGLPTWTDQGDLRFIIHASQGEFLRVVFTPGDPLECFELTKKAFELSEKYQIPIIINSDKYLAEGHWSCQFTYSPSVTKRNGLISQTALDRIEKYERYADTVSGVSPRSLPGMKGGVHLANSDEHDFYGLSDETSEMRQTQMKKRYDKKLNRIVDELPSLNIYGDHASKNVLVCFGSTKNVALEILKYIKDIKILHLNYVAPFPTEKVKEVLVGSNKLIVVENNYTGLLAGLISQYTGMFPTHQHLKDDGRPIFYEDLVEFLKQNGYK